MANADLNIFLKLKDDATGKISKSLKKVEKNSQSFAQKFKANWMAATVAIGGTVIALRVLSRAIGVVIDAARREEDAVQRLNNALEIQGTFTEELSQKYQAMARSLQKSTRFGNEAILELQQQLIAVGSVTEEQMGKATQAAIDFATATNRDLKTAALTVGKALAGFTGELSRYGIILDENLDPTKKAEAALIAMNKQFGGAAQKDIATFAGQTAQMSNAWGDLQEEIGKIIIQSPILKEALSDLTGTVVAFSESIEQLRDSGGMDSVNDQLKNVFNLIKSLPLSELKALTDEIFQIGVSLAQGAAEGAVLEEEILEKSIDLKQQQLDAEILFWEEKANLILAGEGNINDILKTAAEQTVEQKQESQLVELEMEQKKIDLLLKSANLQIDIEKKLLVQKAKLIDAEKKIRQKAATETMQLATSTTVSLLGSLGDALTVAQGRSEKYAKAIQAVRLAEAIISTAAGVANALSTGVYPLNLVNAAVVGAAGAVQIATIASQGFAAGTDTVPAMLSPGEMVFPRTMADAIRRGDISVSGREGSPNGGGSGSVGDTIITIEINNPVVSNSENITELVNAISTALADEAERI